jgi:hypothetical protein
MHYHSAWALQGYDGAPSLDVMLLKQQFFSDSASGVNQGRDQSFQYAYRRYHLLLQFLPLKLAEWVAKNLADELNLPDYGDNLESANLYHILTQCLVSNRNGNNLHTYHCVEFESDLYRGVMRARCCDTAVPSTWMSIGFMARMSRCVHIISIHSSRSSYDTDMTCIRFVSSTHMTLISTNWAFFRIL